MSPFHFVAVDMEKEP